MSATTEQDEARSMRAAIGHAVAAGPDFLAGRIRADKMAYTMVGAVESYANAHARSLQAPPANAEEQELRQVLAELQTCGSGFLAGRCDAACVARTMTWMVENYPPDAAS